MKMHLDNNHHQHICKSNFTDPFVLWVSALISVSHISDMVHYIRFLRTPQVHVAKKSTEINAVIAVATDLGDSLLARDAELTVELVEAHRPHGVLKTSKVQWRDGSRASKFTIACSSKDANKTVIVHVTGPPTTSGVVPKILDVWSDAFSLSTDLQSEPVVERQIVLSNKSRVRIWEETGDSIARHIWHGEHDIQPDAGG